MPLAKAMFAGVLVHRLPKHPPRHPLTENFTVGMPTNLAHNPRNARVYEKRYATLRALYPSTRDIMAELGAGRETIGMSGAGRCLSPHAGKPRVRRRRRLQSDPGK